ncbi:MAG: radical SAM protein [Gemmatimonadetes bacterium]|nr:radical SAM protein [Gemmatimonadota bacterium]
MSTDLIVNEIFHSIQGESVEAGRPCVFVRLTACDLRCRWCDTEYAFTEGKRRSLDDVMAEIDSYDCGLVEVTGGEPLLQAAVHPLIARLLDAGHEVMLETGGHRDITGVDPRVRRIVDLKAPGSGEVTRNRLENLTDLRATDNVKVVIADREDFDWALAVLAEHDVEARCPILFSPVHGELEPAELARWMLESGTTARLQLQLHKLLWPAAKRGV